jgi:hypothetical protein
MFVPRLHFALSSFLLTPLSSYARLGPYDSRVLEDSSNANEKFCNKCKQSVAIVRTDRELSSAIALGKCVALAEEKRKMRGKVAARRD